MFNRHHTLSSRAGSHTSHSNREPASTDMYTGSHWFYPPLCRSTGGLPHQPPRCTTAWSAICLSARQRLVHAHSLDCPYPIGIGFQECFTPAAHLSLTQSQPSSSATSWTGRPDRPTWVTCPGMSATPEPDRSRRSNTRGSGSSSDASATAAGRPSAGRSTNRAVRYPLDHTRPPQLTGRTSHAGTHHHQGFAQVYRSRPTAHQLLAHARTSTGVLLPRMSFSNRPLLTFGGPNPLPDPLLPPHFRPHIQPGDR